MSRAREWRRRARIRFITLVGGGVLRLLAHSWRFRVVNDDEQRAIRAGGRSVVFAFWHGRMLPLLWLHRKQGVNVVISEHGDGEIIARVAEGLGYRTVRGSSSRSAERALLGASRAAAQGEDIAFTPDGPRGPAESVAPGALIVAQRSGAPIIPLAAGARSAWRLRSWDRFLIPKPFARVTVVYATALQVTAPTARETEPFANELAARIREAAMRADG